MMRKCGLFILGESARQMIYGAEAEREIADLVEIVAPPQTRQSIAENPHLLADVDLILSGWEAPRLDEEFLDSAPHLKAFFYGAGAMGTVLTPAVWERGILVTSAHHANSIPVAEYTLAVILFSLKHGWELSRQTRELRSFVPRDVAPGCYGSTVGLISLGTIARMLLKLLSPFALRVIVYDPYLGAEEARALGVERATLEEVFRNADVVSLHAPLFPETTGMITGEHLASMKAGATFINTARGPLVRELEMIEVLTGRSDLQAVLDVTALEPPEPHSPLYDLPNVVLTPHMAGSTGSECRRMGRYMIEELKRYLAAKPLQWGIGADSVQRTSHRPVTLTLAQNLVTAAGPKNAALTVHS